MSQAPLSAPELDLSKIVFQHLLTEYGLPCHAEKEALSMQKQKWISTSCMMPEN
jgi:hypothetical protein